ncbi:laminin subunit alpha-1 [Biomphalaria glabrata]|nr:laminin subunit alpha-1 [Biomphalaria glabrata]
MNGLFPVVFNLASKADISVNATCGETKPEVFCKLVEHVKVFPAENRHCDICDGSSNNLLQRHPIRNAIDGSNRWWQSPSLTNGAQYNYVTITIDLKQIYQVAYIIIKAANAPRPGNWILEKSLDGVNYEPWQYFAMTDRECRDTYRKRATVGVPTNLGDKEVICTSRYSSLTPLENGEIFVSLVNNRPGVFQPSKDLVDFVSARYVRLRFQKIRTLNADLMTFASIDPKVVDETVTRRYFYSVKDISIGGHCICYGHATLCKRHDTLPNRLQCHCQHNTAGDNCEKCLPLHNNKPWQVGGIQNLGCEECNCHGKADTCVYNATVDALGLSLNIKGEIDGGGVCLNCKEYTAGINCERCIDGYYRPTGMTAYMRRPCRKCNCQESQTTTGHCVQDESRLHEGLSPGDCICQKGYTGRTCNACETGFYGYPNCRPCLCNTAGSIDAESCERACICKPKVQGSRCERCLESHFNLEHSNPEGCLKCFCFEVTNVCDSVPWGLTKVNDLDGWMLQTMDPNGIILTHILHQGTLWTNINSASRKADNPGILSQNEIYYWIAPSVYLGNRLSSYGGYLQASFKYTLDDQQQWTYHLDEPNFILKGSNLTIASAKERLRENVEHVKRVRLDEKSWFHLDSRRPITREEMMLVLYSLTKVMIRATYHTAKNSVNLREVSLDVASPTQQDGSYLKSVEQCSCPEGYSGLSCESCAPGYRRVNDRLVGGVCRKCDCYNHAASCDPVTGRCLGCRHNTMGDRCDRCLPGFYGDPRYGTPEDCKPCACPLVNGNNFFAERCEARPTTVDRSAYVCLNCRPGYTGARCEMCELGYFGNPAVPGGSCRRCNCGGAVDLDHPGVCNNITGRCNICTNNTEGDFCEKCKSGYYGVATAGDCKGCDCHPLGSNNFQCDPSNGQCSCKDRYTGRRCDRCKAGYGNISKGCERCRCDQSGSESSQCDPVSGQCKCRPGVGGLSCSQCENGYYDYSRAGCKKCNCHELGTSNGIDCDTSTGRCICKPGVVGLKCDKCQHTFYGLSSGQGCRPCGCSEAGSFSPQCEDTTGQCPCKPGVSGRNCDRCQNGYYGFSFSGCQVCEPCNSVGHICDQLTGGCVCPPYTEGPNCERCQVNCWGYDPDEGCKPLETKKNGKKRKPNGKKDKNGKNGKNKNGKKNRKPKCWKPCNCSLEGSSNHQCDPQTGQCHCMPGYQGLKCDTCALGHYDNLIRCTPCDCNSIGSLDSTCMPTCECDGFGACFCKKNVEGQKCDRCKAGTFSPDNDNPDGCTECFCFGRGRSCQQAPYVYTNIELPALTVDFVDNDDDGDVLTTFNGILTINNSETAYVPKDKCDQPIYWRLPKTYPKDMVLSYNGKLKFVHFFEGPAVDKPTAINAPMVILIGNGISLHTKLTVIEPRNPFAEEITFNEHEWYLPDRDQHVSRQTLMVVLQKVEEILVRASQDGTATSADLDSIIIEQAVPRGTNSTSNLALGVELCDCPEKYSGESCQNPGPGYYRVPAVGETNLGNIDSIIGTSEPCACNSHSKNCEPETGKCRECQDHTTGDYCDVCAEGFYGVATTGTRQDCQPCSCPLNIPSNNFSPSCVTDRFGIVCSSCVVGHTGRTCEKCSPGYYGNPSTVGDRCKPCNCNLEGSKGENCDLNGKCQCLSGISGKTCDNCSDPTFGVQNGQCVSCYEGCTGILLDDLKKISKLLPEFNPDNAQFPWETLNNLSDEVTKQKKKLAIIEAAGIQGLEDMRKEADRYIKMVETLLSRSNYTCDSESIGTGAEACKVKSSAADLYTNATQLETDVNQAYRNISKLVDDLNSFGEKHLVSVTGLNISAVLRQAKAMLKEIEQRNFTAADNAAKNEIRLAEKLSESIIRFINSSNLNGTSLADRLSDILRRLRDLSKNSKMADDLTTAANNKIEELRELIKQLRALIADINELYKSANEIVDDAIDKAENADNKISMATHQSDLLDTGIDELSDKVKELEKITKNLYAWVFNASRHAQKLLEQAELIDLLFNTTRALSLDPVKAAKAYSEIVEAIREANQSAQNAYTSAKEAKDISQLDDLQEKVRRLKETNEDHIEQIENLKNKLEDAFQNLRDVEREVADVEDLHDKNRNNLNEVLNRIDLLPSDVRDKIRGIKADNKDTESIIYRALELFKKFNNTINFRIQDLNKTDFSGINKDIEVDILRARDVNTNVANLQNITKTLDDKLNNLIKKDIKFNLDDLINKINNARRIVNDMKMSLRADGQCIRSYRSPLKPSSANEISFGFQVNHTDSDMLIVLLQQSPEEGGQEFLAAEMKDKKVRLTWNSGKGQGSVSHDEPIVPGAWYKVEAKRIGSIGELKVWNLKTPSKPITKQFTSNLSAGCSLLNFNENSSVVLAGSNSQLKLPSGITNRNFTGCLGDVVLDQSKIGVYNYKTNSRDHCSACLELPVEKTASGSIFVFNGDGYAKLQFTGNYLTTKMKMEFEFKTFWENSRLFFIGNEKMGDFLSIELQGGRVHVLFALGYNTFGRAHTTNTYNNNMWTKLFFERRDTGGALLRVSTEDIFITIVGTSKGLDINKDALYYGGLPSNFIMDSFKGLNTTENFFGCMRNLIFETVQPEVSNISVLNNVLLSPSCRENGIYVVDFQGDGYIMLQNNNLSFADSKNEISLTFVTWKDNGIILVARDISAENYYSIALVGGHLVAKIHDKDSDKPLVLNSSSKLNAKLNDQNMHCVSLTKDGGKIHLIVDDVTVASGQARIVDFKNDGNLYLGGLPLAVNGIAATNLRLDGCISNVIANGVRLSMGDAKQYKLAKIGQCRYVDKAPSLAGSLPVEPPFANDAAPPTSCVKDINPAIEDDAKAVANAASFFAEITKVDPSELSENFIFGFEFRTFYENGLFGFLTSDDDSFYFGIQLHNGRLEIVYTYENSVKRITFDSVLSNGEWHSVQVTKKGNRLSVICDSKTIKSDEIDDYVNIALPLHMGGPRDPVRFSKNNITLVNHSLRGCIRALTVNEVPINITDTQIIQDVGPCYQNVERGAYFGGTAYGALTFYFKPSLTVSLDFKTTSQSGILISISDTRLFGLTLELHDGQVKFRLKHKELFVAETTNDNSFLYCDNKWHKVTAVLINSELSLTVDSGPTIKKTIVGSLDGVNSNYMFIGGAKSNFKQIASLSNDMLNGCLRNMIIDGVPVDWYTFVDQQNVRKTGCPAF